MREYLRNWLGINKLTDLVGRHREERIASFENQLREEVSQAIRDVLDGRSEGFYYRSISSTGDYGNKLQQALALASVKTATNVANDVVSKRIDSEEFIDSVVARINRKKIP